MLILIRTINTFYNAYIIALIILNYNNKKHFLIILNSNIKSQNHLFKIIIYKK